MERNIEHAQCWVHGRRYFIKAEPNDEADKEALALIATLYIHEKHVRENNFTRDKVLNYRQAHSLSVVDEFFTWCKLQCQRTDTP